MSITLHEGDCLHVLRTFADASIDSVVTDPACGAAGEPDIAQVLRDWLANAASGDGFVPGPPVWREVLRVLRPGGHVLCFARARLLDLMGVSLRMAGFEIRDCIRYEQEHGSATARRPAWVPVILARKPLEGTVSQNVVQHGCGALNILASRIGSEVVKVNNYRDGTDCISLQKSHAGEEYESRESVGRFPANVIHDGSDDVLAAFAAFGESRSANHLRHVSADVHNRTSSMGRCMTGWTSLGHVDAGTSARYFYCAQASEIAGDDTDPSAGRANALLAYLCRMVTPPGGVVLDPFAGVGNTGHGALDGGFSAVLVEGDATCFEHLRYRFASFVGDTNEALDASAP